MEEEGRDMPDPGGDRDRINGCSGGVVSSLHESNASVDGDDCSGGGVHGIDDSSAMTVDNKSTESTCTFHDLQDVHANKVNATVESKEDMDHPREDDSEGANPSFAGLLCLAAASDSVSMNLYPVGTTAKLLVDDGKLSFDIKVTGADYAANPPTNEVEYVLASNPATKITKTVPASFIYNHQVSLELPSSDKSCGNEAKTDMHQADRTKDSDKLLNGDVIPSSDTDRTSTTSNGSKMVTSINDTPPSASERSQGKSSSPTSEKGDVKTLEEGEALKDISEFVKKRPSKRAAAKKILSYKEKSDIDDNNTNIPAKKSKGSSKAATMSGILRTRLPGSEHDSAAIDTCVEIIEVLKRKNCVNTNSRLSTKCTCMKSFDPNLARPVATFVATTWYNMSASEKVEHVVQLAQQKQENKEDLHLPFRIVDIIQAQKSSSQMCICRNAMCELLGIGRSLWEKIVDALIDAFDTQRSNSAVVGGKASLGRRAVGKKEGHISRRTVGVSLSSNPNHKVKGKTMSRAVVDKVALAENTADDDNDDDETNGWICRRCDRENEAEKKRCPGCYGWKGGTMDGIRAPVLERAKTSTVVFTNTGFYEDDLKKTAADAAEAAIIALSTSTQVVNELLNDNEVSQIQSTEVAADEPIAEPDVWKCHLCDLENKAEKRRCVACMGWRGGKQKLAPGVLFQPRYDRAKCIVEGCDKNRQHKCNKMCMAHFKEELRRNEGVEDEPNQLEGVGNGAGSTGTKRKRSGTSGTPPTISALLKQYKSEEATNAPDTIIDACASFIQTQLMTKACTNRHNGLSTKCTCIKTLDPALVRPVSSYIVSTWDSMDEDAKISQILEWYQNEAGGDRSYTLPITHVDDSLLDTKKVCRHGLFEVLGVTRRLWEKAMLAMKTSGNETDDDDADEAFVSRRAKAIVNVSHPAEEYAPQRLRKRIAAQVAMSKLGADAQTDTEDERGDEMDVSDERADLLVPEICVGTRILKYFAEGKSYFQGKITKLPGPGNSFYHVRYHDGDEEDLEPHEMWIAFSDWCVANDEIELTEFHPNEKVYAFDRSKIKREAIIKSFRPVQREGSGKWSWSYLVHFLGWNSRHDEWVDENCIKSRPTVPKEEDLVEVLEAEQESNNLGTPTRKRCIDPDLFVSPNKRQRWCCHRCDTINGPDGTKCSHCNYGKDDDADDESEEEDNQEYDEETTDVVPKNFTTRKSECAVEGCTKWVQSHCDGMCHTHHRESLEGMFSISSLGDSEDDADDEENRGFNGNFLCSIEGCEKYRQSGRGGMCCSHYNEAQKKADNLKENIVDEEYEEDFEDDDFGIMNDEASFGMKNDEASNVHCTKEKQCIIDGCSRWRHGWQNICLKHQCEAQVARTFTDAGDDGGETEENEWTDIEDGGGSSCNTLGTVRDNTPVRSVFWSESGNDRRQGSSNETRNDEVEVEDDGHVEEPAAGIEAVVPEDAVVKEATTDDAEPAEATNDELKRAVPKPRSVGHEGASLQAVLELLKDSDDEEDDEDLFG